ncbi:MAG: carbohydrate kinase [Clostridia bacterium]|nr:carbohydrate kinase [Clostridia bacterium]
MPTLCADIFEHSGEILPGGEALNFACIACRYDHVDVSLLGAIGEDEPGRHIQQVIRDRRIDGRNVHVIPGGATATHKISIDEHGDRYFKPGAWNGGVLNTYRLTAHDVTAMNTADIVFCTWYSPNFREALEARKQGGFRLAIDFDIERDFMKMESVLPWVDFFMISGDDSVLPVARAWSEKYDGLFNVTLAERGSVTYYHGKEYRVSAVPVDKVIDTTGCGDSYHAGFICSYVKDGDITAAMHEGSRVASETLSHVGGF